MTAVPAPEPADPELLTAYLDAPYGDIAQKVRADLAPTVALLRRQPDEPRDSYQELVAEALESLIAGGNAGLGFPTDYGGGGDIGGSIVAFQNLAYSDLSLLVKAGVQFGLFGGAILHLGTDRHHER
jgi:acyl-CoA oxidase